MIRNRDADGAASIVRLHIRRTRLMIEKMVMDAPGARPPSKR
jgi:DNA-binding GntR family transcriptional regulator